MSGGMQQQYLTQLSSETRYGNKYAMYYYDFLPGPLMETVEEALKDVQVVRGKDRRCYLDCPITFDIETTNITRAEYRHATMYHWQMLINNLVLMGRTWGEWVDVMEVLGRLCLKEGVVAVIYVHNLGYEYQFIQHMFEWRVVFARRPRAPIYAECTLNMQFRCSYMLSNRPLAQLTAEYGLDVSKGGGYDYNKPRHCKTELTATEIEYCVNDVVVLGQYVEHEIRRNGDITKIPYTQTGYVRRELKERCFGRHPAAAGEYRHMIHEMKLTPHEYYTLKRAYSGGFTHASVLNVGEIHKDVVSYDIASAYPSVICSEAYPMSSGVYMGEMSVTEYEEKISSGGYHIVADISFYGLRAKEKANEHYLSMHKSRGPSGGRLSAKYAVEDNNKIVEAEFVETTITEVDYQIMCLYYEWDAVKISGAYVYESGYLPKEVVGLAIDLYEAKTTLNGIADKEDEYRRAKEMLNSIYGMMVTDIIQNDVTYKEGEWTVEVPNVATRFRAYNAERDRTLYYPWGVYVTAYARRNLLTTIYAMGYDYIYSDTDSVKLLNNERHRSYFKAYNEAVSGRIRCVLEAVGVDPDRATPVDPKGKAHPLGNFELDGIYKRFKTLGAKRYLVEYNDGKYGLTVAGVNKIRGVEYLSKFEDPMRVFSYGVIFPAKYSGKLAATYTDEAVRGELSDGCTTEKYEELSCTHLMETPYSMNVVENYLEFQHFLIDKLSK